MVVSACSTGFGCYVNVSPKGFRCRVGRNAIIYSLYSTTAWLFFLMSAESTTFAQFGISANQLTLEETKSLFQLFCIYYNISGVL